MQIPVQVNGKVKTVLKISKDATEEEIKEAVRKDEVIQKVLAEFNLKKEIYVSGKIYSLVVEN